ncbi:MAG: TadE/TadG family type IV pilus assembly protein [Hyphomicrobiaceae bacterium]
MIEQPINNSASKTADKFGIGRLVRGFRADSRGAVGVEFALVATPLFLMIFSILGYGYYMLSVTTLDAATENASRAIRTGQSQNAGATVKAFKDSICAANSSTIDCSKLQIHVESDASWANISPPSCVQGTTTKVLASGVAEKNGDGTDALIGDSAGSAGDVFLLTACYEFDLPQVIPQFAALFDSGLSNGSVVLQSSTAFRIEPYKEN